MADPTAAFFAELGSRGHEPMLEKVTGRVRFDLTQSGRTDHWLVAITKGDIAVSEKNVDADCVVRASREVFDSIARGEANTMAAYLRGTMSVEGDPGLAVLFQRLFPGPSGSQDQQRSAAGQRRQP